MLSTVFAIKYFEAAVMDVTEVERELIDKVVGEFEDIISSCEKDIENRYFEAFDSYCNILDSADIEVRNVGGIYCVLAGEDIGLMYTRRDASSFEGPLIKRHTSSPISPLYRLQIRRQHIPEENNKTDNEK